MRRHGFTMRETLPWKNTHMGLKHRGDRALVIVGPTLWNNLPVAIRTTTSLSIFKVMLKSHLLDRFAANQ